MTVEHLLDKPVVSTLKQPMTSVVSAKHLKRRNFRSGREDAVRNLPRDDAFSGDVFYEDGYRYGRQLRRLSDVSVVCVTATPTRRWGTE